MTNFKMVLKRGMFLSSLGVVLVLAACSSGKNALNNTIAGFGCYATGNVTNNSLGSSFQVSNLQVVISNGVGPYTVALPGTSPQALPYGQYTFNYPATIQLPGASAVVTVTDTQNSSVATCNIESLNAGSSGSGNLLGSGPQVVATPGNSVAVGTPITLTVGNSSGYSYTFSSSVSGVTVSNTSPTTAVVNSTIATTVLITVTQVETSNIAQISLTFGNSSGGYYGGGYGSPWSFPTCTLQMVGNVGTSFARNTNLYFTVTAASGEPLVITAFNPGQSWSSTVPQNSAPPYFSIAYSVAGPKNMMVWAVSAISGLPCNGNYTTPLQSSFSIY